MPRISKSGKAGMIGGVRSPMATAGHGLVGKKTSMPIYGMSRKKTTQATVISSPQKAGDNV
jgi:hypothetical protein